MFLHFFLLFLSLLPVTHPTLGDVIANIDNKTNSSFFLAKPGCNLTCGDLTVPYPFGIGAGCSINSNLALNCNTSVDPPKAFYADFEVLSISQTQVRVRNKSKIRVATVCVDQYGNDTVDDSALITLEWPYTFSDAANKLMVVGCNSYGFVFGSQDTSGCLSLCSNMSTVLAGDCTGLVGCCETVIPKGMKNYQSSIDQLYYYNYEESTLIGNCSYAFLGEQDSFQFHGAPDILDSDFANKINDRVTLVLDFVIGNQSCAEALKSNESLCQQNTTCIDMDTGYSGYRCSCSRGYEGNPYLSHGCSDIDECKDPNLNDCGENKVCQNHPGSFSCACKDHYSGDGRRDGSGCIASQILVIKLCLALSFGSLSLLIGVTWLYFTIQRRKLIKLKEQFFKQNGGLLMKQKISSSDHGKSATSTFYTVEDLKKATNNYAENRILGRGGYGVVYKGILPDQRVVAIKKSKVMDGNQVEQFINELFILTQVNHRNVVKLLGCCFESEVPELVYEYVSNGTLFQHIHKSLSWLTLDNRLRIAAEAANALSYLHSAASISIIHRDVKSTNILLDANYVAKMADFGASRLVPLDQTQVSTLVQGTLGYLDPEYFQSSKLTEKSDVYSFGVVLAELMTGKKPICLEREMNLANYFIMEIKENRLFQILEPQVVREGTSEQLQAIAELVKRCVCSTSKERPAMKEVVVELERLRKYRKDPWVNQHSPEQSKSLSSDEAPTDINFSLSTISAGDISEPYYNIHNRMEFPLNKSC